MGVWLAPRATGVGNKDEAAHHRAAILALWSPHCQAGIGLIRPIPHYQNLLFSVASTLNLRADRQAGQGLLALSPRHHGAPRCAGRCCAGYLSCATLSCGRACWTPGAGGPQLRLLKEGAVAGIFLLRILEKQPQFFGVQTGEMPSRPGRARRSKTRRPPPLCWCYVPPKTSRFG